MLGYRGLERTCCRGGGHRGAQEPDWGGQKFVRQTDLDFGIIDGLQDEVNC